ncbi:MAG: HEPN domain-containing protein [Saccharolobus sp.]|uniref:Nucleotidyltransferase domain protein n=2 Tax=Saccharolobus shibatae TaxID=2286 RepID=A0A8F5C2E4_9CREN|nr:HEPN domain-containing protein [Saccharolobus shibatae]MCH4816419.1 HEPN domain-containing protein [Saccharolobus shibatae]QXJ29425.1 Nucleotidyltransferase domain protein [Saccharolobus shibatae B12]QXJ32662.1 Nucleotidyltransferase domain protein [Saccharolobus shibatae]QXJ35786.1 Nucleotidyltransferase domain protein [Saccharolobus shibatae]
MDYKDWLVQAIEDLDVARILIEGGKYFASAFYSQQAVEKALKAFILFIGKDPGKTHSLTELLSIIENEGFEIPQKIKEDIMVISPHFIISRYPDAANGIPAKQYNKTISIDIYNRSKEVIEWLKESLR